MGDPLEGVAGDILNSTTAGIGAEEDDASPLRRREVGLPVPLVVIGVAFDSRFFFCREVGVVPPSDR